MPAFPNTKNMLPGAAFRALVEFYKESILSHGIFPYSLKFKYNYPDAMAAARTAGADEYTLGVVFSAYTKALDGVKDDYPLKQDAKFKIYREGFNSDTGGRLY